MNDQDKYDEQQSALAKAIKVAKDSFSPLLTRELHTQLATEYKIIYDCYRKAGFNVVEALRLTVKYYD